MTAVPIVNDGLWRSLCPISSNKALTRSIVNLGQPKFHLTVRPHVGLHSPAASYGTRSKRRGSKPPVLSQTNVKTEYAIGKALPRVDTNLSYDKLLEGIEAAGRTSDYDHVQNRVHYFVNVLGHKPSRHVYEALILANCSANLGSAEEVALLLEESVEAGIVADSGVYHAALRALAVHPDHLLRAHVLEKLRERWFQLSNAGYHDVAVGLLRERQIELALHWLEQMEASKEEIQPWLYDMFIFCLCDIEEFDEALRILKARLPLSPAQGAGSLAPSGNVWYYFLDAVTRAMHYEGTLFAFNARIATEYLNPPTGMCNNILTCAARNGDTKLATAVFNVLSKRSGNPVQLYHYETLVEAYLNRGDLPTALSLLSTVQSIGYFLTPEVTRPVFMYLKASLDDTFLALNALETMRKANRPVPLAAVNVVIESFIHHASFPSAIHLYDTLALYTTPTPASSHLERLAPNLETYNLLLRGCRLAKDKPKAMFLAAEMVALKVPPDANTYDRLVGVCMDCDKDLEDAWKYVLEIKDAGWKMSESTENDLRRRAASACDSRVGMLDEMGEVVVNERKNEEEKAQGQSSQDEGRPMQRITQHKRRNPAEKPPPRFDEEDGEESFSDFSRNTT